MKKILLFLLLLALPAGRFLCSAQEYEQVDTLEAAHVTSDRMRRREVATQTGLQRIDASKINRGFALFNTPDIIKTLQMMPGVASGTELISGLYVHGGDGSDNLYLLDGVPLFQVSHLIGLFSSFNSDVVDEVDFYKSGFPARYGGRMSSVVDVKTRDGNFEEYHGSFSLGLIDGRLQLEGPVVKGKTSFNLGLRRTWNEVVTIPALMIANKEINEDCEQGEREHIYAGYNFTDFNAKVSHKFSDDNLLSVSFYGGDDRLPISDRMENSFEDDAHVTHYGEDLVKGKLAWGNLLASANWQYSPSDELRTFVTAYHSRSRSLISAGITEWSWDGKDNYNTVSENVTSKVSISGLTAEAEWKPSDVHNISSGALLQYKKYIPERSYGVSAGGFADNGNVNLMFDGMEAALFAEDEMSLAPWLKVNAGVRGAMFLINGKNWLKLEPRAAFKVQVADNTSLRFSYSEMNQFDHIVSTTYLDLPTNTWMPSTAVIKPMFSRQFAAGVYSSPHKGLKLTLEGWYKTMDHMYEYGGPLTLYPPVDRWESDFVEGKGKSYGLEASAEYDTDRLSLSAYYTLGWSWRKFEDFYVDWYPDRNDNRHKLDLLANYTFPSGFELYAGWHYHTGNNITVASYSIVNPYYYGADIYDKPNSLKLPDYHRLDAGLNFHHKTRRGNDATWNLSIYNAYCRLNAIYGEVFEVYEQKMGSDGYYYSEPTGEFKGRAYGIVPIIPTFGYTLKF